MKKKHTQALHVSVIGIDGSGKSTFLNILGGLDTPTGGEVLFRGQDISRATQRQLTEYRRRHVGFVFQHYALFRHMSVFENVAFGLRVQPRSIRKRGFLQNGELQVHVLLSCATCSLSLVSCDLKRQALALEAAVSLVSQRAWDWVVLR